MRIGLSTAAFYGQLETEDAAAHLAGLGVTCCEVFLETYSEYTREFGEEVRRRLGRTQAVSVHSKTQHFEADVFGASARQQADAFSMLSGFLDAGNALGARLYVFHGPPNVRESLPNLSAWDMNVRRMIREAALRGIRFAWEAVSWCYLNSPQLVRQFRQMWPELAFVLDIKQIHELGQDPFDYVDAMGDALAHVHVLDWDESGRYRLPGEGLFDYDRLAGALARIGYRGDVILEPYGNMRCTDDALLRSMRFLAERFA